MTSENSSPFSILTHQRLNAQIERNKMHREENYLLVTATPLMLDAEAAYELKRRSRRKTNEKYSIREAAMLNTRVLCLGDWVSLVSELDRGKLVILFSRQMGKSAVHLRHGYFRLRFVWSTDQSVA